MNFRLIRNKNENSERAKWGKEVNEELAGDEETNGAASEWNGLILIHFFAVHKQNGIVGHIIFRFGSRL